MNQYFIFKFHPKVVMRSFGMKIAHIGVLAPTQEEANELANEVAPKYHFVFAEKQDAMNIAMAELAHKSGIPSGYFKNPEWHTGDPFSRDHDFVEINFRQRKIDKLLG